jgi:hypothetical protein
MMFSVFSMKLTCTNNRTHSCCLCPISSSRQRDAALTEYLALVAQSAEVWALLSLLVDDGCSATADLWGHSLELERRQPKAARKQMKKVS